MSVLRTGVERSGWSTGYGIGFRGAHTQQIAPAGRAQLKLIETVEQGGMGRYVNALIGGEARLVATPLFDGDVDPRVGQPDSPKQRSRRIVPLQGADAVKSTVEGASR